MDINVTLVVQILVFAAFVWFTMKFVWPPLSRALEERQNKIADGLAAAERGHRELELAQHRIKDDLKQAKKDAADIIDKAHHRAAQMLDEAKEEAMLQAKQLSLLAQEQLALEVAHAKSVLQKQLSALVVAGAEKILMREVDSKANHALLDQLIEEI